MMKRIDRIAQRQAARQAKAAKTPREPHVKHAHKLSKDEKLSEKELRALQEKNPDLTDDQLQDLQNPWDLDPVSFSILQNSQENQKRRILIREEGLKNIAHNVSSKIASIFQQAQSLARRNQGRDALSLLQGLSPSIDFGLGSLSGSDISGVDMGFIGSLQGQYASFTQAISDTRLEIQGLQPSDEDLLRLTGRDTKGHTTEERREEYLSKLPKTATTPQQLLETLAKFPKD